MTDLLPCPWCGDSIQGVVTGDSFRWRWVGGCCGPGPEVRHDTMSDDQVAAELDSTQRAIEAWNTRAPIVIDDAMMSRVLSSVVQDGSIGTVEDWLGWANFSDLDKNKILRAVVAAALNQQEKPE